MLKLIVAALVLLTIHVNSQHDGRLTDKTIEDETMETQINSSLVLSRRKRFIIFPEGSSLQLVFCNTFPIVSGLTDIVLWGYTSALAFELPQDPYSPFMHHADPLHRRVDTKTIYYTDEKGRIIHKQPVPKKKFLVNPAFAKRSANSGGSSETSQFKKGTSEKIKIDRKHAWRHKLEFLKSERSLEFHRQSRSLLYRKIETMLQGLGANGRQCILETLCLVGRAQDHSQGSFFQEILRAVFTFPKGTSKDSHDEAYEIAHWTTEPCDKLYSCNISASESRFPGNYNTF